MEIWILSYTAAGRSAAERASAVLTRNGHVCRRFALPKFCAAGDEPLTVGAAEWAGEGFAKAGALVFCCASGIAVRAIAPHVRTKTKDPAVLVMDERGRFVIPLLSGHLGGANELAETLASGLGATPVFTTATDVNGLFAVDVFARRNHLRIADMTLAKEISAALLAGQPVGFRSDLPTEGTLPPELTEGEAELGVLVSAGNETPFPRTLRLIPRRYVVGMGCRRGKSGEELELFFRENLLKSGVSPEEVRHVASIDLKKDEPGLQALCRRFGLELVTYPAERLREVPGDFSASAFVKETTGVDSVCERAALAEGGTLITKKTACNGMTFALAKREEAIRFE